jgi:hypothetical protein
VIVGSGVQPQRTMQFVFFAGGAQVRSSFGWPCVLLLLLRSCCSYFLRGPVVPFAVVVCSPHGPSNAYLLALQGYVDGLLVPQAGSQQLARHYRSRVQHFLIS